jgi:hypothetical protein
VRPASQDCHTDRTSYNGLQENFFRGNYLYNHVAPNNTPTAGQFLVVPAD